MSTRAIGVCSLLVPLLALMTSSTLAQTPLRRYRPPAGPTITPYLNYNRVDLSTLPNARRSFVVPQQEMQRDMYDLGRNQQELARNQQENFRKIETGLKQIQDSRAAPTGVGASFQNYSHYYPNAAVAGRRR